VRQRAHDDLGHSIERLAPEKMKAAASAERDADTVYRRLQLYTPEKAPILAMLDEPYRLDFGRNPIAILDLPGVVSPAPGMPTKDAAALAAYLEKLGIRYVAFVRPARSKHLYSPKTWETAQSLTQGFPQQYMAPTALEVLTEIEQLAASHSVIVEDGGMVVLDLKDDKKL
jgi:hypothetical protein